MTDHDGHTIDVGLVTVGARVTNVVMTTCETCTHWNPVTYPPDATRSEYEHGPEPGAWGYCALIGANGNDRHDDTADPGRDITSPRAFTRDGSDYWSALITRADFGCIEHEEKPA